MASRRLPPLETPRGAPGSRRLNMLRRRCLRSAQGANAEGGPHAEDGAADDPREVDRADLVVAAVAAVARVVAQEEDLRLAELHPPRLADPVDGHGRARVVDVAVDAQP